MINFSPKLRSRMITFFISLVLSGTAVADTPKLCEAANDVDNYDTDFLDNFITLKEGEDGWLFRDTDLKTKFGPSEIMYKRYHFINRLLKEWGTTLFMVPIPTRGITQAQELGNINYDINKGRQGYHEYLDKLRKINIVVPDLEKIFDKKHEAPLFFARDHHWTSYGAEQVAKITAEKIKQHTLYKGINKQEFETKVTGTIEMEGSHQKAAAKICETEYPDQIIDAYSTENISEIDLFADVAEPEVVLVGTSNSKAKANFNFSGYLMQYSKLDILNLAKSGGGYDGAILDYLKSDDFKNNSPKILIWEVPGYYSLNSKSFYIKMARILKDKKGYKNNESNANKVVSRKQDEKYIQKNSLISAIDNTNMRTQSRNKNRGGLRHESI